MKGQVFKENLSSAMAFADSTKHQIWLELNGFHFTKKYQSIWRVKQLNTKKKIMGSEPEAHPWKFSRIFKRFGNCEEDGASITSIKERQNKITIQAERSGGDWTWHCTCSSTYITAFRPLIDRRSGYWSRQDKPIWLCVSTPRRLTMSTFVLSVYLSPPT
jgi:hypothetical protein